MESQLTEEQIKSNQTKKLLLYFAMISMVMMFAGITSAVVVSSSRKDWLQDFQMPSTFWWSTLIIIISSVTFHAAWKFVKKNQHKKSTIQLLATFLLALGFVWLQFYGFEQIVKSGYYFTGSYSNITTTFIYIVVLLHLIHLAGGLLALIVVIINHLRQKYTPVKNIGMELALIFWHFLGILWILLFLFLYFN